MRRRAAVPAGAAARSHGMQLCRQAQQFLSIGMLYHVSKIYIYILSHMVPVGRASARSHCFQFLSFEIKTKNFCFGSDTLRFFFISFSSFFFLLVVFAPFWSFESQCVQWFVRSSRYTVQLTLARLT